MYIKIEEIYYVFPTSPSPTHITIGRESLACQRSVIGTDGDLYAATRCILRMSFALFVVGFSDDRRLAIVVRFGVAVFVLCIIIVVVGVSRRRVAHDGDEAPIEQPCDKVLGDARGHVDSCWMSRRSSRKSYRGVPWVC